MGIGWQELLFFMLAILLLFGANKLPSLMRNLGRSANEFKAGMRESVSDSTEKIEESPKS